MDATMNGWNIYVVDIQRFEIWKDIEMTHEKYADMEYIELYMDNGCTEKQVEYWYNRQDCAIFNDSTQNCLRPQICFREEIRNIGNRYSSK